MSKFDEELVSGSVARSVLKIAWPAVALNVVNGMHGMVDQVLVGRYVGPEANAAIGVAWSLFLVLVVFLSSLFHGMNVLIARYTGRQDPGMISEVAYNAFLLSMYLLLFVVAPIGYFLAPKFIPWVTQEPEVQRLALIYLQILFLYGAPLFLVLLTTFAMQASGNPKTPMFLGILSTTLNLIFSFVLITRFGMGVAGAAIATCFAPLVSLGIVGLLLFKGKLIIPRPPKFHLIPDFSVVRRIVQIGLPTGVQAVLLNFGGVILLIFLDRLENSTAVVAAYTICYSQLFALVTWASWGLRNAASAVIGQNIGAGKTERGVQGVYIAVKFGIVWSVVLGCAFYFCARPLLSIFGLLDDPLVLTYGTQFLSYLAFSGVFLAASLAFTGGLIGAGDTKSPLVIAFFTQIVVLLGTCYIALITDRFTASTVWGAILASHALRYLFSHIVFARRRWRHIIVDVEHRKA